MAKPAARNLAAVGIEQPKPFAPRHLYPPIVPRARSPCGIPAAGRSGPGVFCLHIVRPGRAGVFETRPGPLMAGVNALRVTVHGAGGHGSRPAAAIDPVPAIAELTTALHVLVTRAFDVGDPVVLSVTQLAGSDAINVIPPSASLGATIRTLSPEATELIRAGSSRRIQS